MSDQEYEELIDTFFAFWEGERTLANFELVFNELSSGEDLGENCFGEPCLYRLPPHLTMDAETKKRFHAAMEQDRWEREPEVACRL